MDLCIEWNREHPVSKQDIICVFANTNRPLDTLTTYEMKTNAPPAPIRFAVRQVLEQEYQTEILRQRAAARQARYHGIGNDAIGFNVHAAEEKENTSAGKQPPKIVPGTTVKRDFFGRVINEARPASKGEDGANAAEIAQKTALLGQQTDEKKVWVSFHEGYSNAVRKPITMRELLSSL